MQLSLHSDYALRLLIYLGTHHGRVVSTQTISDTYGISKHHLVRVVQTLGANGYVTVLPGRSGGVQLTRDPASIRLGDVVRCTEPHLRVVECFAPATNTCPIVDACALKGYLQEALSSFLSSLNQHTLADLLSDKRRAKLETRFIQLGRVRRA